jgi:hypothetical protein
MRFWRDIHTHMAFLIKAGPNAAFDSIHGCIGNMICSLYDLMTVLQVQRSLCVRVSARVARGESTPVHFNIHGR